MGRHILQTLIQIKRINPKATVEALIPDLMGKEEQVRTVVESKPDIINYNLDSSKTF